MTHDELIEVIKSKGYWRILFQPIKEYTIEPLSQVKQLVEKNSVSLRGWDYPHIPRRQDDNTSLDVGENFWQGWINWPEYAHFEFWRFFQSGQFVHYTEVSEDWREGTVYHNFWDGDKTITSGELLGVVGTIFLFTEIYQFLSKLTKDGIYPSGVTVNISLNNTASRKLYVDSPGRTPFIQDKKTISPKIEFNKTYSKKEALEMPKELAREAILYLFDRFNWQPAEEQIDADQEKFLQRKI